MSKKKHKKSNPHSAPQPKAKSTQPAKQMNPLVWGIGAIVVVAALIIVAVLMTQKPSNTTTSKPQTSDAGTSPTPTSTVETYTPPALEDDVTYTAKIDIQDYGTITVELDQEAAPITCANFVELARRGYVVLAQDMPSHGESDNVPDMGGILTGLYESVKVIADLPYVVVEKIGITGHSLGGMSSNMAVTLDNAAETQLISAVLLNCADAT